MEKRDDPSARWRALPAESRGWVEGEGYFLALSSAGK